MEGDNLLALDAGASTRPALSPLLGEPTGSGAQHALSVQGKSECGHGACRGTHSPGGGNTGSSPSRSQPSGPSRSQQAAPSPGRASVAMDKTRALREVVWGRPRVCSGQAGLGAEWHSERLLPGAALSSAQGHGTPISSHRGHSSTAAEGMLILPQGPRG